MDIAQTWLPSDGLKNNKSSLHTWNWCNWSTLTTSTHPSQWNLMFFKNVFRFYFILPREILTANSIRYHITLDFTCQPTDFRNRRKLPNLNEPDDTRHRILLNFSWSIRKQIEKRIPPFPTNLIALFSVCIAFWIIDKLELLVPVCQL